jgi:ATP-dependent protease Clp ATPase subunit
MRRSKPETLQCSFCHKSQAVVGKLISAPSDYPEAHICDECIQVCVAILADEGLPPPPPLLPDRPSHCLMCHPDAPQLLQSVEQWILAESQDRDPAGSIVRIRILARMMLGLDPR